MNRGETHSHAKLTTMDVILIRDMRRHAEYHKRELSKITIKELADKFEVSRNTIWKVGNYVTWKHV